MSATPAHNERGFHDALERGYSVIPGIPRTKKCYLKRLRDLETDETIGTIEDDTAGWKPYQTLKADEATLLRWLLKWPDANPLVITGEVSGIIALDMDGIEAFASLRAAGLPPPWPYTATMKSPGGEFREHYYYSYPKGLGRIQGFAGGYDHDLPHVDLRADGGLVVYCGAVHKSGGRYEWLGGLTPDKWGISATPDWLVDYIRDHNATRDAPRPKAENPVLEQMDTRLKAYAQGALQGECGRVAAERETRNTQLFKSASALSRFIRAGALSEAEVWQALEGAASDCHLTQEDGASDTRSTIQSGLRAGADKPIKLRDTSPKRSGATLRLIQAARASAPGVRA